MPKTRAWDADTNTYSQVPQRHADVYVFALLAHRDQDTLDPLDLSQWQFFVVPTTSLDNRKRSQRSITLRSLQALAGNAVNFAGLRQAIEKAGQIQRMQSDKERENGADREKE